MKRFEECLDRVLAVEKGFIDHPADRGGPTNLGVTIETLSRYTDRLCTVDDVKALTPKLVAPIYRRFYWDPIRGDELPEGLGYALFDQAVLRGPQAAVKSLQAALGVREDGIIGPKTLRAIGRREPRKITFEFLRRSHEAYLDIVQADPSQLAFVKGWSRRVFDLLSYTVYEQAVDRMTPILPK